MLDSGHFHSLISMTLTRKQLGNLGERVAADYVYSLGWEIVATQVRVPLGETDLICREGDVLVFVEVRTRTGALFGDGIESVDEQKLNRMSRVAQSTLHQYNWKGEFRLDVIGLYCSPSGEFKSLDHRRDISP